MLANLGKIKAIRILENRKYLLVMLLSSLIVLIGFPAIQIRATGTFHNFDIWLSAIPKLNLMLFIAFSFLFGLLISLQVYSFLTKTCSLKSKAASTSTSGISAVLAALVPGMSCLLVIGNVYGPGKRGLIGWKFPQ